MALSRPNSFCWVFSATAWRLFVALAVIAATSASLAAPAGAQVPAVGAPQAVDANSSGSSILRPSGLGVSVARDGTGGLVYLKSVGGVAHVFVSRLRGGSFQPPVQVDAGLSGASSQPVIAAGNAGLLLVAFVNSSQLYVAYTDRAGRFGSPQLIAGGAIDPAISATSYDSSYDSGKAYLAFALPAGSGYDVRTAYYYRGSWGVEQAPLNVKPGDNAGAGSGRPAIAAAGDGTAVVVWGEGGHVYSQQVWGTQPYGTPPQQADMPNSGWPPSGCSENSADHPVVGVGGDSSYAPVAFREQLTCSGHQQSRVVVNRLRGGFYDGVVPVDGVSAGSSNGAADPQIAVGDYAQGWVTSTSTTGDDALAGWVGYNGWPEGSASQVNGLANSAAPYPVPASTGVSSAFVAWQQWPGSMGGGEIRMRYEETPRTLGSEAVVSSPAQGSTDAADGLAASGDRSGDGAIAWLQGSPGATKVMIDQLYLPPGSFEASKRFAYTRTRHPVLAWNRPSGWGPMTYSVSVERSPTVRTLSTAIEFPTPLKNGPHRWHVVASNPAGQQTYAPSATVFVDTLAPRASLGVSGSQRVGGTLRARIRYADLPPAGERRSDASGIAAVVVRWGDGTSDHLGPNSHLAAHSFGRPGVYRVRLVVSDRAGNVTRVVRLVTVGAKT